LFKLGCHAKKEDKKVGCKTRRDMVLQPHIVRDVGYIEGKMLKQKLNDKKQAKTKNVNLMDCLLAIDFCLT
jgi:hypothetical protein